MYLPIGLFCGLLARFIPFIVLITIVCSLAVILGDPWLYVVHKWRPRLIPALKFNFMNFTLILFIMDPGASTP